MADIDITGYVNLVLFVCLVVYLTRLRATLTRAAEAQERIARVLEERWGSSGPSAALPDDGGPDR